MKKKRILRERKKNLPTEYYSCKKEDRNKDLTTIKEEEEACKKVDRISELPNELLQTIISLLPWREAPLTKTLSTRWRDVPTPPTTGTVFNSFSLDFPSPLKERRVINGGYALSGDSAEFEDYITHIDHFIRDLEMWDEVLHRFKIDIPCTAPYYLDKCLRFALSMKIESIEIRVIYPMKRHLCNSEHYKKKGLFQREITAKRYLPAFFPNSRRKLQGELSPRFKWSFRFRWSLFMLENHWFPTRRILTRETALRSSHDVDNCCLKELSLVGARVSNEEIEQLLLHLVVLERLLIESPRTTPNSNIDVTCYRETKLKQLIISNFSSIASINVSNLNNLVSLRCYGLDTYSLTVNDAPKLVTVGARCGIDATLDAGIFAHVSFCNYTQPLRLELVIGLRKKCDISNDKNFTSMCYLSRLAHLDMKVMIDEKGFINQLFCVIKACPNLEILEIQFKWSSMRPAYYEGRVDAGRVKPTKISRHLKTTRLSGYFGSLLELKFVLRIVNNATCLRELIVEPRYKNEADRLESLMPPSVDLIIR